MSDSVKKRGYLCKFPVKGLLMKKWTKRWFILYGTSHEGVVRVEYYDNKDCSVYGVGKRTIPLRDCSELTVGTGNKIHPYVFQFKSQIGQHILSAESQPEMESWMDQIKKAVHEDRISMRRSKTQSKVIASPGGGDDSPPSLRESGLSYKNKVDSGTYRVTVEENETSLKMNLSGTYSLELSPAKLSLVALPNTTIFTLQYKYLKNYGKQSGQFHFETGKVAPIGEGKLIFVTTCSKEIFGVVHGNIKKLKEKMEQGRPDGKAGGQNRSTSKAGVQSRPGPTGKNSGQDRPTGKVRGQSRPGPAGKDSGLVQPSVPPPQRQNPPQQRQNKPKISASGSSRPGSRHSSEIVESSIPGTYRISKELDELEAIQNTIMENVKGDAEREEEEDPIAALYSTVDKSKKGGAEKEEGEEDPIAALYSTVDKSNKTPKKKKAAAPSIPNPYNSNKEEETSHRNSTRDSRVSYALVEIEENVFNDSFDDDDDEDDGNFNESNEGNLMPLTEGATNPLDGSDFLDYGGGEPEEASGMNPLPPSEASNNMMNFDFDLGDFQPNDPFKSEHLAGLEGAAKAENMAEFDFGRLDANFFEKLEATEVPHAPQESQEFDQFWNNMDGSVEKL